MKSYLTFALVAMIGLTGYIVVNKPGTFKLGGAGKKLSSMAKNVGGAISDVVNSGSDRSYDDQSSLGVSFKYIMNSVVIHTRGPSYKAKANYPIRTGDNIFSSTNSFAIIRLNSKSNVKVYPGSSLIFERMGTQDNMKKLLFSAEKGVQFFHFGSEGFTDQLNIMLGKTLVQTKTATFTVHKSSKAETYFLSVFQGTVKLESSNGTYAFVDAGKSSIIKDSGFSNPAPKPWSKNYKWERDLGQLSFVGEEGQNTWKLTSLADRPPIQMSSAPKWDPSWSKQVANKKRPIKKQIPNQSAKNVKSRHGNSALSKVLKKVPGVGSEYSNAIHTITNSEDIAKQRINELDALDEE